MKIYNLAFLLLFLLSFPLDRALEFPRSTSLSDNQQKKILDEESQPKQKANGTKAENIIFKSSDGGQTWHDISAGLPVDLQEQGFPGNGFIANNSGLYIRFGNEIYHSKPDLNVPFWKKENFPDEHGNIAPGNTGIITYNWAGQTLQKTNGSDLWAPMNTNFKVKEIRTVFETTGGTIFIGAENGLFRSTDNGKTLKHVVTNGWVIKIVESNGILMATSQDGIIRSEDDGENWNCVLYEGGVGIDISPIKGGFAAINYNTESGTRRVRTTYDGGKTWQAIDGGLKGDQRTASIIQVDEDFFCGHPDGIYKSSDKGETWKLIRPSINNLVFNLFVSGNAIYAIPRSVGC